MAEKPRILLIDGPSSERDRLERILNTEGFEAFTSSGGGQTISLMQALAPHLIVLRVELAQKRGYQVCRELRGHAELGRTPIVLLSSREALDERESLACGADDYLLDPPSESELVIKVKMTLKRCAEDRWVSTLTGLPGSSAIDEEIKRRVMDRSSKFSVLFIDLDNFKAFNHAYGFLRGDEVIKLVGRIAGAVLADLGEQGDFLGHDGGDDFVLVTGLGKSGMVASRIIDEFDQQIPNFYRLDDLTRGYVVTQTRQGAVLKHPIMTLSIGMVGNEKRPVATHWEVREIGREIKEYAKRIEGSGLYPDRRAS